MWFTAIASVINGYISTSKHIKQKEAWFRLGMSIFGTSFVSFSFTFGTVAGGALANDVPPLIALAMGVASGAAASAVYVAVLWKRSPLTKGIPIAYPGKVEEAILTEQEQGTSYTERG